MIAGNGIIRRGRGRLLIQAQHLDRVHADGEVVRYVDLPGGRRGLLLEHQNSYVLTGLNNSILREFGGGGTAVGYIGVSNNTTAVTSATVYLNGGSAGAAANTIIKALTTNTNTPATATQTAGASFANADFTSGVFVWNKIGLLTTATDAGTGLVDVIGGTGGSSPYTRTFALDLTGAGTFSVAAQIAVTASAA